ncbi:hypothetical protein DFQ27_009097 [Actinomortierella ambigua]|uniref:RhoGAP-domain-containing protein n=1 Tax=Actinomortierella ambigua TaxID=1343610 RepID=A0A9P6UB17_9FUNG|nr:hypothetical protein DFQ27_009097 [Actinomortierella ambigua]
MNGSFVRALGNTYHLECFKCLDCEQIVASKFFPIVEADGKQYPLCERDYFRRLNLVCHSCGGALRGSYITALDYKYHIEHFTCSVCPTVFGPQDSYYEHDGKVYCHYHYSLTYAVKCAGCQTAILKQFVEINRNSQDEHWHPECYMIHKFWNVKLAPSPSPISPTNLLQIEGAGASEGSSNNNSDVTVSKPHQTDTSNELKSPEELKRTQQQMEEKVYQIWTVLSAFEESSAGCISEMLLHVSNGAYYDGVQMAEKFILHVEILFNAIDDLEIQMQEAGDPGDMSHGREAKMLCKKIVNFFSLLSHTQESGVRRLGMTQELLSLVTGLAHYLKILIRIALTYALKLERQYNSSTVIARFLNRLMELANKDKYLRDAQSRGSVEAEVTSDLCLACKVTIEDECFRLDHHHRWHPKCLICANCSTPLASVYYNATFDANRGSVLCQQCKTPESHAGFSHVTKLEQYTFLLRVALVRLENLLRLKGDDVAHIEPEQRGRDPAISPSANSDPLTPPGLIRKDTRSKSYSSDDNRQYETGHLSDLKRVKSTHLDRKLSNSARFPRRQTVIAHARRRAPPMETNGDGQHLSPHTAGSTGGATAAEPAALEIEIIDEKPSEAALQQEEELARANSPPPEPAPPTLSDLTERLAISTNTTVPSTGSTPPPTGLQQQQQPPQQQPLQQRPRASPSPAPPGKQQTSTPGPVPISGPCAASNLVIHASAAPVRRMAKRQYLNELSALELFIVKHLAVLTLAPLVSEYFTLEELLDLIGQRKQTLWGRFVKGLKTDKKKPKVEGTFGVPLEVLVERNGVDSSLGAGPGRIRIPSFVDDSISSLRQMDMSVEGIFRKNGNIRRLKELSDAIDKDPSAVNLAEDNPVQVAALLKKFLRDLPDPLLTFKLHRLFVVSQKMEDEGVRKLILHLTCCLLPKPNRDSMEAICLFLRWVASFSHVDEETGSKMDLHNLATVITPNVLYSKSKDPTKDESFLAIEALMGLLEYQDEFCLVPEDLSSILDDQDLLESSMDLSSKDILKRCENYVKTRVKKSHSLGDLYADTTEGIIRNDARTFNGSNGQPQHHQQLSNHQSEAALLHNGLIAPSPPHSPPPNHHSSSTHVEFRSISQLSFGQQQAVDSNGHPVYNNRVNAPSPQPSLSATGSPAASVSPVRIPQRPPPPHHSHTTPIITVGGGAGSTPMSL